MENYAAHREFIGIYIPATIWCSKRLSITEKMMLAEIDSLHNQSLGCTESNAHFAKLFRMKEREVSEVISSLERKGALSIINSMNENGEKVRTLRLNSEIKYAFDAGV